MASHTLAPFPDELLAAKKQIRERARSYGLDWPKKGSRYLNTEMEAR